ncbi:protein brambleberry-like [Trichogramma pretiosum]|uniref:protein brambleberry-like n=1 Tax=Trichogramma pretiosum TaxID=7493 RepID=UPI0006C9C6C2|nr:protein brambleberry-like [Trichogramma pretiosum]
MKIKTSCSNMSEKQLAKLCVNLLNCQSTNKGRITIKECNSNMKAATWNAYHLMSNRAKTIRYSSRSNQF